MKTLLLFALLSLTFNAFGNNFPLSPDLRLTPGALCTTPSEFRYPEQIPYCAREVHPRLKDQVFLNYRQLGYSLSGDRSDYKVDHFIPLCLGGSNDITNLWPQNQMIYEQTDALEQVACDVLTQGRISQYDVVRLVTDAKMDLRKVPETIKLLRSLK